MRSYSFEGIDSVVMQEPIPSRRGAAFAKGSGGCLLAFVVIAALTLMAGGTAYIDAGGFVMLIIIGGIIGLIVNAIYRKGQRDSPGR